MIHVFLVELVENTSLQKSLDLFHSNDIHYAVSAKFVLLKYDRFINSPFAK
jgi:hypothetical protein